VGGSDEETETENPKKPGGVLDMVHGSYRIWLDSYVSGLAECNFLPPNARVVFRVMSFETDHFGAAAPSIPTLDTFSRGV